MTGAVVGAFLIALVAGEVTDGSRWVGVRLARWAARRIYRGDALRAAARAEEWEALIIASFPTSLSALCFGLSLSAGAVSCDALRFLVRVASALGGVSAALLGIGAAERERRDRLVQRRRVACLDLLSAASTLRLQATTAARVPAREIDLYLADIHALAASVELAAANVAMLAPSVQAAAARLAEASERLADEIAVRRGVGWRHRIFQPGFGELDESAKAFLLAAAALPPGVIS